MNAEVPFLRFWQSGTRTDFSAAAFWSLAAGYEAAIDAATRPRDLVLVLGHTRPETLALFAAIVAAGRVASWFPPNGPQQDKASYVSHQRAAIARIDPAAIILFDAALRETIATIDASLAERVLVPDPQIRSDGTACRTRFLAACASPDAILVQHSSGTTGIKKAVRITGTMLTRQAEAYWPVVRALAGGSPVRIASWLPLYHDMGLMAAFLLPLLGNDTVSIIDPFEWIAHPEALFDIIEQDTCEICWMPNFAFRHLVRLKASLAPRNLASMRAWINCSEACRLPDAVGFEAAFAPWGVRPGSVAACYAMAETVFAVSQAQPHAPFRAMSVPPGLSPGDDVLAKGGALVDTTEAPGHLVLSSGIPVAGMSVRIMHGDQVLADGKYGEIALRAAFLFDGYAAQPTPATADGFFRTGDLGTSIDGHLFVLGRTKEIIIVNGKNLFAGDIEAAIGTVAGLKPGRIVAFGTESAQTGSETLVIVAEQNNASPRKPGDIRADITRLLSETFLVKPADIRIVADRWLVKSTSGKISRDENRRKYLADFRRPSQPAQRVDA